MSVKKSSLIWLASMYATIALTLPYEWRTGILDVLLSSSIAAVIIVFIYLLYQINSKMMGVYIVYNLLLIWSTWINDIPLREQILLSLSGITLVGAFELINKYASKKQFNIYTFYYVFLVIVNSLQTIYYGGSRDINGYLCIFGNKNWYFYKILPAIFLVLLMCAKYKKHILSLKFNCFWGLAFVSVILAGSGTGTLALGLWGIYIIFIPLIERIKQNKKFDHYIVYSILIIFIFFTIVIWNAAEIFAPIIVGLLGKDLTFTTRTRIWERALELITKKPIIGYGAMESESIVALFYGIPDFTTTHNQYLGELFRGGIPLLMCFIALVYLAFKRMQISDNIDVKKAMTFGIFCLLLWWMMESITSMYLVLVLFICYHLPDSTGIVENMNSR